MSSKNPPTTEYQIALPKHLEEVLGSSFNETAVSEANPTQYEIVSVSDSKESSELKFDPITVTATVYVANIIVSSVAGYFIWKGLDRLLRNTKPTHPIPGKILVSFPDGNTQTFDITTQENIEAAISAVKAKLT